MRTVQQPGPAQAPRIIAIPVQGKPVSLLLRRNTNLLQAVAGALASHGYASGVIELSGMALAPFSYVMPALSIDGKNAAFYSDIFRPAGITRLDNGALTFGRRNGAPFFHCHALWQEADGRRSGGHILPEDTMIADDVTVQAYGFKGAAFEGNFDPETNFTLFGPVPDNPIRDPNAFAVRLRPNRDFCTALEDFCAAQGIKRAHIRGGVGSTIGARWTDGTESVPFATEVFIRSGVIGVVDGRMQAKVDAGLVDYTGGMAQGTLIRGDNPVLMTFELVLVVDE